MQVSGIPAVYLSVAQSLSWLLGGFYSGFLWNHKGKISHFQLQALREGGSGARTLRGSVLFCFYHLSWGFNLFISFFFLFCTMKLAGCCFSGKGQVSVSEVGQPSPGYWTVRELPASGNTNQQELSQRSPSQY